MDEVKRWNEKHDLVGQDLPVLRNWLDNGLRAAKALGARGQLPSGSMLSTWRVLKQFTHLLPSG